MTWYMELGKATQTLVNYVLRVKKGEDVLVFGDDLSDETVVKSTAAAAYAAGATPTIVLFETRKRSFVEPPRPFAAAMMNSDVVVELEDRCILYTEAQVKAEKGYRAYVCLNGVDAETMVRTFAWVNYEKMVEFGDKLAELTNKADEIRMTSPSGTDFTAKIGGREFENWGSTADKRQVIMMGGQTGGSPIEDSENGVLAIDSYISPPPSRITTPVKLKVEKGVIKEISGGAEADTLRKSLAAFRDPNMYRIAHISYGYHPMAQLTGGICEAERLWGGQNIGWGTQGPLLRPDLNGEFGYKAATHCDGIISNVSVYLDGELVEKEGKYIHPELVKIAKEMGVEQ